MTLLKITAAALVIAGTVGAANAYAADAGDCIQAAKQATAALNANAQSPQYEAARQEASAAQSFCAHGLYQQGVDRYAQVAKQFGGSNG